VFVPVYFFRITYSADWSGSVGRDSTDGNNNTSTFWSTSSGNVTGSLSLEARAHLLPLSAQKTSGWVPLDSWTHDGGELKAPGIDANTAFLQVQPELQAHVHQEIKTNAQADRFRDLDARISVQACEAEMLYFPAFQGVYQYKGTDYPFTIDGQSPSSIVAQRPTCDTLKQTAKSFHRPTWMPVLLLLAFGAAFLFALLDIYHVPVFLTLEHVARISIIAFPIALIVGAVRKMNFLQRARTEKEATLTAISSTGTNFEHAASMFEKNAKKRRKVKRLNRFIALVLLLGIIGAGIFGTVRLHTTLNTLGSDLLDMLDNEHIQGIHITQHDSEDISVALTVDLAYLDTSTGGFQEQLRIMFENTRFFVREESDFTLRTYQVYVMHPDGHKDMYVQWSRWRSATLQVSRYNPAGTRVGIVSPIPVSPG